MYSPVCGRLCATSPRHLRLLLREGGSSSCGPLWCCFCRVVCCVVFFLLCACVCELFFFLRDDDCIPPRDTSPHQDSTEQPLAAHRRRHSRPHHRTHGEHSPTACQSHSNGLCSPPNLGLTLDRGWIVVFLRHRAFL